MFLRSTLLLSSLITLAACGDDGGGSASDASTGNATPAATDPSTGDASPSTGMTSEPATTEPTTSTTEPTTSTTEPTTSTTEMTTSTTDPMTTMTSTTTTEETTDTGEDTTTGPLDPSWAVDVYPVLDPMTNCGCHTQGAGDLILGDPVSSYMNLVGVPSAQGMLKRVEPGDSSKSFLWHKVNGTQANFGGGNKMPPAGPDLPQETIDLIAAWIDAGALP